MRIWDLPPSKLCRNHLLGEHQELHALWNILTDEDKTGYSNHPETCRWRGKRNALYRRHEELVDEMNQRGYNHNSPLDESLATGEARQNEFVNLPPEQEQILREKDCDCFQQESGPH